MTRALLLLLPLAACPMACVAPRAVAPAPPPRIALPPPPSVPVAADWRERAVTPGTWSYAPDATGAAATFGRRGGQPLAVLRCDRRGGRVFLSVLGSGTAVTVRTSSVARTLPAGAAGGDPAYLAATLTPRDALLDAMAFSRGRFAVEGGTTALVLPAWAEVGRVIEDCRG